MKNNLMSQSKYLVSAVRLLTAALACLLLSATVLFAGNDVVVTIGDRSLTADELKVRLTERHDRTAVKQLLEEMVRSELLLSAAKHAGYDQDPELLVAFERMVAGKYKAIFLQPMLNSLDVSETEIERYYQQNQTRFTVPRSVRAAVIKVAIPSMASAETRVRLRGVAETARDKALSLDPAPLTFGSVAVEYSDDQASRYRGGDTGWMNTAQSNSRWPAELIQTIDGMKQAGNVGPVLALEDGYYLYKLIEDKEAFIRPMQEVRGEIYQRVLNSKAAEAEEAFYAGLQKQTPVIYNQQVIEELQNLQEGAIQRPPALPQ